MHELAEKVTDAIGGASVGFQEPVVLTTLLQPVQGVAPQKPIPVHTTAPTQTPTEMEDEEEMDDEDALVDVNDGATKANTLIMKKHDGRGTKNGDPNWVSCPPPPPSQWQNLKILLNIHPPSLLLA
jgi:hypothetical protein